MYNIQALPRKNSKKYSKTIASMETVQDVKEYLERNRIEATGTPYIFTHINLSNNQIITQDFNGIICSPDKLARELGV